MRYYATLFDKNYLSKGLALHESLLKRSSEDFRLYVLAMDNETANAISGLDKVRIVTLNHLEQMWPEIAEIRQTRTWREFCWTMASNFCFWLSRGEWESITYLDADLFFFCDPEVIFEEIGQRSIAITPHHFGPDQEHCEVNGRFNVGLVYVKNDTVGQGCLKEWAAQCRDWCYYRNEDGKFGDQGYLNIWPAKFGGALCIIENLGVNLGPWSLGRFNIKAKDGGVFIEADRLVCYHFHEYQHGKRLTNWPLRPQDKALIYAPYIEACNRAEESLKVIAN